MRGAREAFATARKPVAWLTLAVLSCGFDEATRWDDTRSPGDACTLGQLRCTDSLQRCTSSRPPAWSVVDDCAARGLVCSSALLRCAVCSPSDRKCDGSEVLACTSSGAGFELVQRCDPAQGQTCRAGGCVDLCARAALTRSNMGCEYWAADLDNAVPNPLDVAAAQQFAVVVSNPQPDVRAHVVIEQDDALPGQAPVIVQVASADVPPMDLRVFKLGPREVDGSPPGEFNTGTGTALTRHAWRVRSQVPVVAYQFNPLDNVGVFSNDASLLKPVEALTYNSGTLEKHYVITGWPQTIAITDDPDTNFGTTSLRAFVALVGTRPDTRVRFHTTATVLAGGPIPLTPAGAIIEAVLQPFDVLNLETGEFLADFTGSLLEANQPLVVFSGSEASDAPAFAKLAERRCCADHLEEQNDPIRTAGRRFIVPHAPNVSQAVAAAGGGVTPIPGPETARILAVSSEGPTRVRTSLPPPYDDFELTGTGDFRQILTYHPQEGRASGDFQLDADRPVIVSTVQSSQVAAGVSLGMPGGDPSLIIIPPVEQYRSSFVFLTPDKYAFDFVAVIAPADAAVFLDGVPLNAWGCESAPGDGLTAEQRGFGSPEYVVHRCPLSSPRVDPNGPLYDNITTGEQHDGVHRLESDRAAMVIAYGFDNRVSYGYAAGAQLETLHPAQ
jgi:hypothetical protein